MTRVVLIVLLFMLIGAQVSASGLISATASVIRYADHEIVYIFNSSGNKTLVRFEGGQFSVAVRINYPVSWHNGIMLHNHVFPATNQLSPADLQVAQIANLKRSLVVSANGRTCTAERVGTRWTRIDWTLAQQQVHNLIDYQPWNVQDQRMEQFITGLAPRAGFKYWCVYG